MGGRGVCYSRRVIFQKLIKLGRKKKGSTFCMGKKRKRKEVVY